MCHSAKGRSWYSGPCFPTLPCTVFLNVSHLSRVICSLLTSALSGLDCKLLEGQSPRPVSSAFSSQSVHGGLRRWLLTGYMNLHTCWYVKAHISCLKYCNTSHLLGHLCSLFLNAFLTALLKTLVTPDSLRLKSTPFRIDL